MNKLKQDTLDTKTMPAEALSASGLAAPAGLAKRWTKRDAMKLQSLTRKIIRMDSGDHNIRRMAYECEVRASGDSPNERYQR